VELLAHVAVPAEPPPGPLPILVVLHEFFGLSESSERPASGP
jgi:hypothetical protein